VLGLILEEDKLVFWGAYFKGRVLYLFTDVDKLSLSCGSKK